MILNKTESHIDSQLIKLTNTAKDIITKIICETTDLSAGQADVLPHNNKIQNNIYKILVTCYVTNDDISVQ